MEYMEGRHFSITDKQNVNTVIYQINTAEKNEISSGAPKHTVERLPFAEQLTESASKKTFFVDNPKEEGNQLLFLTFANQKVVVNTGIMQDDKIKLSKKSLPIKFDTLYSESEPVYKEFKYSPNLQRTISIIDPETTEEVKPTLYVDKETKEVKGKIMLQPKKYYFAFEVE